MRLSVLPIPPEHWQGGEETVRNASFGGGSTPVCGTGSGSGTWLIDRIPIHSARDIVSIHVGEGDEDGEVARPSARRGNVTGRSGEYLWPIRRRSSAWEKAVVVF